jgi:ribosomal protein L13E
MSDTDNDEEKKEPASSREASKAKAGKRATSDAKRKTSRSSAKAKGGKKSTEGGEKGDEMSSDTASAKASSMRFGPAPKAVVSVRHLDSLQERPARGFSLGELSSSGISRSVASHETVTIDMRRRSVVDQNVEALKAWLKAAERQESTS